MVRREQAPRDALGAECKDACEEKKARASAGTGGTIDPDYEADEGPGLQEEFDEHILTRTPTRP